MIIQQSLAFLEDALNEHLKNKFQSKDQLVLVNRIVESDGTIPLTNQNKVVMTLINIEQQHGAVLGLKQHDSLPENSMPPIQFHVKLLVSSHFLDYNESLRFLEETLDFFYMNEVFDASQNQNFPVGVSALSMEMASLNYAELKDLWTTLGGKQQPSLSYTLRFNRG